MTTGFSAHVDVEVDAGFEQLPIIRAVAGIIAMRADLDLDMIADLTLAVDEVCSTLIGHAVAGARLRCRFAVLQDEIHLSAVTESVGGAEPDRDSLGWHVVTTLTDRSRTWVETSDPASDGRQNLMHIEVTKRRTAARR